MRVSGTNWWASLQAKSVHLIPGVGPERAARLAELGISNIFDLLYYFPFRYEVTDARWQKDGSAAVDAVFQMDGEVSVRVRGRKSTVSVWVRSGTERVRALFFNQSYLRQQLKKGAFLRLKGKYDPSRDLLLVSRHEWIGAGEEIPTITPVYRSNLYWGQVTLRKIVLAGVEAFAGELCDDLPLALRERYRLVGLRAAVEAMHKPKDREGLRQARRRLVFEEFLRFQLEVQGFRASRAQNRQVPLSFSDLERHAEGFLATLPFAPTSGQREALAEILKEIAAEKPMHRLLHGEVGAGKTLVVYAAVAALAKLGWQAAMMVPTSVLAWQHAQSAAEWLAPQGVRVAYLSGLLTNAQKAELAGRVAAGAVDFVIGTQVLTRDDLLFANLRLVVIDEQHRFGVQTRKLLRKKGEQTDVLQMTATPIPRTYALTLYGDIEVSTLRELPPGREPVQTSIVDPDEEDKVIRLLRRELARGKQAFVIAPRIVPPDEGEAEADFSAVTLHTRMDEELAGFAVGLVHGGQPEEERMRVMDDFAKGRIRALVATTIVEVGVNVPAATVIVIYGGDRFGLATLHQLRGRVGRSTAAARCIVIARPESEYGKARLDAFLHSDDGFFLAEQDLRLRGPGEAFGERQSGIPVFQVGDVLRDLAAMQTARQVAREWLGQEDFWLLPTYAALREWVLKTDDEHADA